MSGRLQGRVAVVTGAGRGIGREVALALAGEGALVVVNDYGVELDNSDPKSMPAESVAQEIRSLGGEAIANFDSVASMEGGRRIVESAVNQWGRLDILVNNAGIIRHKYVWEMTDSDWDDILNVNLRGQFCCIVPAVQIMKERGFGRIVNMSSSTGTIEDSSQYNPLASQGPAYSASKAGVVGLTLSVARQVGEYGITCNAVAPSAATRMAQRSGTEATGYASRAPECIPPIVAWLCSDAAWNVNGKLFYAAGGRISMAHERSLALSIGKDGIWSLDELDVMMPAHFGHRIFQNSNPPATTLKIPGRDT